MMRNKVLYLLLFLLLILGSAACNKGTNSTSNADQGTLPHSMKGYELYSWQEQGQWHFTLITGTNRVKILEEIISGENVVSQDGWVRIHAVGVDEINAVLSRLLKKEFVFWNGAQWLEQTQQADNKITFPPAQIIDTIKEHARQCGLDFQVLSP
jgi:hypothetical protein